MTPVAWLARTLVRLMPKALQGALVRVPAALSPSRTGGWWPVVREPYTGAWQQNAALTVDTVVMHPTVFSCVSLIASDCAKLRLRLVEQHELGVWIETTNPAYSPLLRRPNPYQTPLQFVTVWMQSKLLYGNTYALKVRDARGVVVALHVLDPRRVWPLVAPDGSIYYELQRDDLSGLVPLADSVILPAAEICHDLMNPLFHPLVGLSPIVFAATTAGQGLKVIEFSSKFFTNMARPGGLLIAPGEISPEQAARVKATWEDSYRGENYGRTAVFGNDLKYQDVTMSAVDAQLIDQLKWTSETIADVYHVPPYLAVPGAPTPPYTAPELLFQQYYSQCVQTLLTSAEQVLDFGLGLDPLRFGVEFDIDDLVWMDTATKTKAAADGIGSGALSPNEARQKYFGLGPVVGGESPYLQQQNYSLAALAERDAASPFAKPPTPPPALPPAEQPPTPAATKAAMKAKTIVAIHRNARNRYGRRAA